MGTWFTPGPWEIKTSPRQTPLLTYREILGGGDRNGNPFVLGELYSGTEHDEPEEEVATANAHLIAAAPDLYEALEALLDWQRRNGLESGKRIAERATQALAKARGEQP